MTTAEREKQRDEGSEEGRAGGGGGRGRNRMGGGGCRNDDGSSEMSQSTKSDCVTHADADDKRSPLRCTRWPLLPGGRPLPAGMWAHGPPEAAQGCSRTPSFALSSRSPWRGRSHAAGSTRTFPFGPCPSRRFAVAATFNALHFLPVTLSDPTPGHVVTGVTVQQPDS